MTLKLDNSIPKDPYTKQLCQNRDLINVIRKDKKIEYELKVLNALGLLSLWQ